MLVTVSLSVVGAFVGIVLLFLAVVRCLCLFLLVLLTGTHVGGWTGLKCKVVKKTTLDV